MNVIRSSGVILLAAVLCVACGEHQPRSFEAFKDDSVARDGVLARCSEDPVAAEKDIECANARRAAAAVAAAQERASGGEQLIALRDGAGQRADGDLRAAAEADKAPWVDPSNGRAFRYDVYADHDSQRRVPSMERAVVAPPASNIEIPKPDLTFDEVVRPRPLQTSGN